MGRCRVGPESRQRGYVSVEPHGGAADGPPPDGVGRPRSPRDALDAFRSFVVESGRPGAAARVAAARRRGSSALYPKIDSGMNAETIQFGASTISLIRRSAATLATT